MTGTAAYAAPDYKIASLKINAKTHKQQLATVGPCTAGLC